MNTCPVCNKEFLPDKKNHVYCDRDCYDLFLRVTNCKEVFRLTEEEQELRWHFISLKNKETLPKLN